MVFGGHGFYGRHLIRDLLTRPQLAIVTAGRRPSLHGWPGDRVAAAVCDIRDAVAVRQLVAEADLTVHCAGPFQRLPLEPARAAAALGKPFIDISEDRSYYREVSKLAPDAERTGGLLLPGLSVVPGMMLAFCELATQQLDRVASVRTYAAPDTRRHRGPAMFETMLRGVGRPYMTRRGGCPVEVRGWTKSEWVTFPPPIGRRLTYLVLEMADLDLVPEFFDADSDFKAGCEWPWVNRALNLCAVIRARLGHPQLERWTPLIRSLSWALGRIGNEAGGVVFAFTGERAANEVEFAYAVTSRWQGGRIPAMLASIAAHRILDGRLARSGIIRRQDWLSTHELAAELMARGLELWTRGSPNDSWQQVDRSNGWRTVRSA